MAIIFFDGFNRDFDSSHWSRTNETAIRLSTTVRAGSGPNSLELGGSDSLNNRLMLSNIGTHAGKKLYLGFALHKFYLSPADANTYPLGRQFLRFFNNSNVAVLTIGFDIQPSSSNSQVPYGSDVDINVIQSNTVVSSYRAGLVTNPWWGGSIIAETQWLYFEFELDLQSATNTIAINITGTQLLNSTGASNTNIATIDNISKIEFTAGNTASSYSPASYIDDLYLIDNTGTRENTWLGPETVVRNLSPDPSDNFDSAAVSGANQWFSNGDSNRLHTDDGDISGIRTASFNQRQLYNWSNINTGTLTPGTIIGAVRISTKAKNASAPAAYRIVGRDALGTDFDLSDKYVMTNRAYTVNGPKYILNDPATNARWTVPDFNAYSFGVKSENPA